MNKTYITKKSFKNLEYLKGKIHTESNIFINNNELYKFLKKEYYYREKIIERLDILNNNNIVIPNTILYDKKGFLGYSMTYYKDYKELENTDLQKLNFEQRKSLCIKLCNILDYMTNNHFAYPDIHEDNILIKDEDIKIIDLDSGIFKDIDLEKYDEYLRTSNYLLSNLCLSILYSKSYIDFEKLLLYNNKILNNLPKNIIEFYNYIINKDGKFISTIDYIDKIDENMINDTKKLLKI